MNNGILSRRLKEERKKRNLTQKQLADSLGVALSVIAGAETKRGISKSLASKLAEFFDTSIDYWINENAEEEFVKQAELFEMTKTVVFRFIDEGVLNSETALEDKEIMNLIIQAIKFDITVLLKKKGL